MSNILKLLKLIITGEDNLLDIVLACVEQDQNQDPAVAAA